MRLVRCHVENFGTLKQFDYEFNAGLNSIKAENGFGKTTLATFIKAMFYGLPATTKKSLNENERKKYLPWQGGNFGGNLVFHWQGQDYKIERFFGKNKAEDTFNVIKLATGKKDPSWTENVGEILFGLDAEAFERSAYIPQKAINTKVNESMAQKLHQVLHGAVEEFNFEGALEKLDKKRIWLSNTKKTGEVEKLASKIEEIQSQIHALIGRGEAIPEIQNQVATDENEIQNLVQQQKQIAKQINDYGVLQQKHAHQALYAELKQKVAATEQEIATREAVLNQHHTNLQEIENYTALAQMVAKRENEIQIKTAGDYTHTRASVLQTYFHGKIPPAEKVQTIYDDVLRYQTLNPQNVRSNRKLMGQITLLVGALLLLCGGLILAWQIGFAVALLVLGGLAVLVGIGLVFLPQAKNPHAALTLQQKIVSFLSQYEMTDDYLKAIQNISNNLHEYETIQNQMAWNQESVNALSQTLSQEKTQLAQYLAQFKFPATEIKDAEKLVTLKQTLLDLAYLQNQLQTEKQNLAQFKAEQNWDLNETVVITDIDILQQQNQSLQNQIDAVREHKTQATAQIKQIQNDLAQLDDWENQKQSLQTQLKECQQAYNAVQAAIKYLKAANESLTARFLAPMKNGLTKYLKMVTKQDFDNLHLDTTFALSLEEFGQERTVNYYSQGYQDTFDLCLRFALIDTLYQQEKPFIVLDDPFVNLDEDKIAETKRALQVLSQNYQLIYFTCHGSRC